MKLGKDSLTVMTYVDEGGISGASVFVALYDLLQKVDESFSPSNHQLKKSMSTPETPNLNIFEKVNDLRKDRAYMVNTYENYKLIFLCLDNYGKEKEFFDTIVSKASTTSRGKPFVNASERTKNIQPLRKKNELDEDISDPEAIQEIYVNYNDGNSDDGEIKDIYVNYNL